MLQFESFKNVDSSYRSAPIWSWNDELDEKELIHQIHEMHNQGIGGFIIHPRGGMKDEYLGDKFMKAVRSCIEEAEFLGMKAWLYDDERYPSGGAAGRVVKAKPEFGSKILEMIEKNCDEFQKTSETVKIFLYNKYESSIVILKDITDLAQEQIRELHGRVLIFEVKRTSKHFLWNNESYIDICCKQAMDKFIEETHHKYKNEFGQYFTKVVQGIFTDEPLLPFGEIGEYVTAWPYNLQNEFENIKGYSIADNIYKLFFEVGDYRRIRFDYWDVIAKMFVNSFTKNIYNWCEENGMRLTGHLWEHTFPLPRETGSTMPNYEYMNYPGIDILFNTEKEIGQFGNVLIVKEASSVGNQFGKERIISETYGGSGWELNFNDQKRIVDWLFSLGINMVSQHIVAYSLKGYRKRDFPLSFSYHQPWWNCYRLLGDYIGRVSYAMSQGCSTSNILMLHPYSSIWSEYNSNSPNGFVMRIGESTNWLTKSLMELHYGFDIGDDTIIEKHGKVEENKFIIGNMAYNIIILPDMTVLRVSNFKLLREFAHNGGKIIVTGLAPFMLNGEENDEVKEFFQSNFITKIEKDKAELKAKLYNSNAEYVILEDVNNKDTSKLYCQKRKSSEKVTYFVCNIDKKESYDVKLMLGGSYLVEEWDPISGDRKKINLFTDNNKNFYIKLQFHPVSSHLLVVDCNIKVEAGVEITNVRREEETLKLCEWAVKRKNYNAFTLKLCQYKINNREWSKVVDVLEADREVKDELGIECTGVYARQPWMYTEASREISALVKVKYRFNIGEMLTGDLYIAAEAPEQFTVLINGIELLPTDNYHHDRAFVMFNIKDVVKLGVNEVIFKADNYNILTEIECIYVLGDFKVNKSLAGIQLINEASEIQLGDWTKNGYPYYSGTMMYSTSFQYRRQDFDRIILCLEELWSVAVRILVNDKPVAILGWKPYETDITDFIIQGGNTVTVEIMNSLQNMLGPHNNLEKKGITTPGSFYYGNGDVYFEPSGFSGIGYINIYKKIT